MHCPICAASAAFAFSSIHAEVLKCSALNCGHLFAHERPAGTGVQTIKDHTLQFSDYEERNGRLIKRLCKDGVLFAGANVLDFGSGLGHVALALRDLAGANVTSVEADPESAKRLQSFGLQVIQNVEDTTQKYDLITMIEVIEHLDDPIAELRKLRPKLNPDGRLFVTTPCGETTRGSIKTNAYDIYSHVQFFTERSLNAALNAAGFGSLHFVVMNQLYPRQDGPKRLLSIAKDLARPIGAMVMGHYHLVGYATA